MRGRGLRVTFVVASLVAAPRAGLAQEASTTTSIAVEAPAECPQDIDQNILLRTPRVRRAPRAPASPHVDVRIVAVEGGYRGSVSIEGLDDRPRSRIVEAPTCDEVGAALALIAALAIDPEGDVLAPRAAPEPPVTAAAPLASSERRPARDRRPAPRGGTPVRPSVSAGFGLASGLAPVATPGGLLVLELGFPADAPRGLARAGASYWASGEVVDSGATASFAAILARLDGCWVAVREAPFWAAPCATLDLGSLSAEGVVGGALRTSAEASQLWAAPGPSLRLGLDVVGPVGIALEGALTFPLQRGSFVIEEPTRTVHEVPVAAGRGGIDVSLQIR